MQKPNQGGYRREMNKKDWEFESLEMSKHFSFEIIGNIVTPRPLVAKITQVTHSKIYLDQAIKTK